MDHLASSLSCFLNLDPACSVEAPTQDALLSELQTVQSAIQNHTSPEKSLQLFQKMDFFLDVLLDLNDSLQNTVNDHEWNTLPQRQIHVNTLLDYAHYISRYTAAPIGSSHRIAYPPIPQDAHMRLSMLFKPIVEEKKEEAAELVLDQTLPLLNPFELNAHAQDHAMENEEDLLDLDL